MKLEKVETSRGAQEFLAFGRQVYDGDPFYRDNSSESARAFLFGQTRFASHSRCLPILVSDQGQILTRAALITDDRVPDYAMLGFFEARENAGDAVGFLLAGAGETAAAMGYRRVIIGLNGHFAYGMGFLASHFTEVPCFGFPYNPAYYPGYFAGYQAHHLTSFAIDIPGLDLAREQRLLERVLRQGYTFRLADRRHLGREAGLYTAINNAAYQGHLFWAPREPAEDLELFRSLGGFLQSEHLIFVEKDGEAVGYLLWYPDLNQVLGPGEKTSRRRLESAAGSRDITRLRIGELCLRPEHQGSGAVMGLIEKFHSLVLGRYSSAEAGWIFDANFKSAGLVRRWENRGASEYKQYRVYEMEV